MDDETINEIIAKLNLVTELLTKELPDMDVSEWRQTPIGRSVGIISEVVEIITREEI